MVNEPKAILPQGIYQLIGDRIVVIGGSSWAVQDITTIAVLHPKQTKPEHKVLLAGLLAAFNESRAAPVSVCQPDIGRDETSVEKPSAYIDGSVSSD